jgi:hypothetical protein
MWTPFGVITDYLGSRIIWDFLGKLLIVRLGDLVIRQILAQTDRKR